MRHVDVMGKRLVSSRNGLAVGRLAVLVVCSCLIVAGGCGDGGLPVSGRVTADGKPVDMGTISFRNVSCRGVSGGAGINDGTFKLGSAKLLPPGSYQATLMAYRRTGRTIDDPLRGPQPETMQVNVADNPQVVEITHDNAGELQLDFRTEGPR